MRGKIFGRFFARTWGFAAAAVLIAAAALFEATAKEPSPPRNEQNQSEQDRCKFWMDKVSAIILSLDAEGKITFLNHYGEGYFGYSAKEIIGPRGRGRNRLPRSPQNGVGDEGGQKCVESRLDRCAGQSGIGDPLWNQDPPERQSGDDVGSEPFSLIARQPSQNRKHPRNSIQLR